jgi:dihydrofolate reductase
VKFWQAYSLEPFIGVELDRIPPSIIESGQLGSAMRTQYYTAASLDGFIATVDDSLEWLFPLGDINDTGYPEFIKDVGTLAMGSSTYEWMLRHVINPGSSWPYSQPTWVFSSRFLTAVQNTDIRFVSGDVRPVHEQMRAAAQGKNIWLVGGGDLVGQFYDADLLDDIIVQVGSVTLGAGKQLMPRKIVSPSLKLVSVQQFGPGFAELRYEVPHHQKPR